MSETPGGAPNPILQSLSSGASTDESVTITPVERKPVLTISPVGGGGEDPADKDGKERLVDIPGLQITPLKISLNKKDVEKAAEASDDDDDDDDDEEEEDDDDDDDDDDEDDEDDDDNEEENEEESEGEVEKIEKEDKEEEKAVVKKPPKVNLSLDQSPAKSNLTPAGKKRGRPSKADLEQREKERQAAIARGEPDPELKRKRRKPKKLADGASEDEKAKEGTESEEKPEKVDGRKRRKRKPKDYESGTEEDEKMKKKRGRAKKVYTEEQLAKREEDRKAKYAAVRQKQREKKEKRKAYLERKRDERKAQKEEEKRLKAEHEKRMAELKAQYLDDNAMDGSPGTPGMDFLFDESSQGSGSWSLKKKKGWADVGSQEMSLIHNPLAHVTAETLFEYKWPLEGRNSEHYFLQEQVTEYLGVKSFKRRYPDCPRRTVDFEERDFLMEMKIVNETQADLGLTAIPSSSVLDIMCQDFYDKYEMYVAVLHERKERSLRNFNYSSGGGNVKLEEAVKAAAEWNKQLNLDRQEKRNAHFDLQTFTVHYPKVGTGRMRVIPKQPLGDYPIALIPGQFTDNYKAYKSQELRHFPLNTVLNAPPKSGTLADLNLGSDGSESDSGESGSSGSGTGSEDSEEEMKTRSGRVIKKEAEIKKAIEVQKKEQPPKKKRIVDEIRPSAVCKHCQGNINQNKLGQPEMLLHCTKCQNSCHPTCVGLHLDLLSYVTDYDWECTECKKCMTCHDLADEDKMLFCDLCDRGYHIFCVGLSQVPSGRWHCIECANCVSCGTNKPCGGQGDEYPEATWVFETKSGLKGDKIYSHTMCQPCHKIWKKGLYCPECNGAFGRTKHAMVASCWVCSRQHHAYCVGVDSASARFICSACQRRTQEKTISGGRGVMETPNMNRVGSAMNTPFTNRTPVTSGFSRSGRRITQLSYNFE